MVKTIYYLSMLRSKKSLVQKYGKENWKRFRALSNDRIKDIIVQTPDIGNSVFSFNYQFAPSYIAWYKSFLELGLSHDEVIQNIWLMNERLITTIPRPFLHAGGKSYLNGFRKKASEHVTRQRQKKCHPLDWNIEYREIDKNTFELDITECGFKKLAHSFDVDGLLPGICRIDYLIAHLMGNGFVRNKTLGDGDDCCNCRYELVGTCAWSPENGFVDRK